MQNLRKDPKSGLILPRKFIEEKHSLKKSIEDVVERAVSDLSDVRENYFLTIHAKFDKDDPTTFVINAPVASLPMPKFISNSMVFWVCPPRGLVEMLWMVAPTSEGEKLKVEFNNKGVAYLQAKQAMPKAS